MIDFIHIAFMGGWLNFSATCKSVLSVQASVRVWLCLASLA